MTALLHGMAFPGGPGVLFAGRHPFRPALRSLLSAAVVLAAPAALLPPFAQVSVRRPDTRIAAYPTASILLPPSPLQFTASWEREIPGEGIVRLSSSDREVFALSRAGNLFAFEGETGAPLWSASGLDPAVTPVPAGALLYARSAGGALVAFDSREGLALPLPFSVRIARLTPCCVETPLTGFGRRTDDQKAGAGASGPEPATGEGSRQRRARTTGPAVAFVAEGSGLLTLIESCAVTTPEFRQAGCEPPASLWELTLTASILDGPIAVGNDLWAILAGESESEGASVAVAAGAATSGCTGGGFVLRRQVPGGYMMGRGNWRDRYLAIARHGGRLDRFDAKRGRVSWSVRTGTDAGAPPLFVTTIPGKESKKDPEHLLLAGTMDGLLIAFDAGNGHLIWASHASSRISSPMALWIDESQRDPDQVRLLVAGEGSHKLEAFRTLDGLPAGSMVLDPESAIILAGPVMESSGARCLLAWSPYPPAGSRLLSLRLSSVK